MIQPRRQSGMDCGCWNNERKRGATVRILHAGLAVVLLYGHSSWAGEQTAKERIDWVRSAVCQKDPKYASAQLHPLSYAKTAQPPDFEAIEIVEFRIGDTKDENESGRKYSLLTVKLGKDGQIANCQESKVSEYEAKDLMLASDGKRTVESDPGIAKAFNEALRKLPDEMRKSGYKEEPIPVRFPQGERGERITAYTEKARKSDSAELQSLLSKAGSDAAILREILSGIARSENSALRDLVRPYLRSGNDEVRASAVAAWGKIGNFDDAKVIEPLLQDKNPVVRMMTETAIASLKSSANN